MKVALIAAGSLAAFGYVKRLQKEAETIETIIKGSIWSIKSDGVHVRLDVTLKNPSRSNFTFSFPFLTLKTSAGDTIGTSQADNSVLELQAGSELLLKPIMLTIPLRSILSLGLAMFKAITDGKAGLSLETVASSYAHLLMGMVKHKVDWKNKITLIKTKSG
jgi:hypothetical protein